MQLIIKIKSESFQQSLPFFIIIRHLTVIKEKINVEHSGRKIGVYGFKYCDTWFKLNTPLSIHLAFSGIGRHQTWTVETSQIYLQSSGSMTTSALNSEATATSLPITMLLLWCMTKDEEHHLNPLKQAFLSVLAFLARLSAYFIFENISPLDY
jgi:hypothetical protein